MNTTIKKEKVRKKALGMWFGSAVFIAVLSMFLLIACDNSIEDTSLPAVDSVESLSMTVNAESPRRAEGRDLSRFAEERGNFREGLQYHRHWHKNHQAGEGRRWTGEREYHRHRFNGEGGDILRSARRSRAADRHQAG